MGATPHHRINIPKPQGDVAKRLDYYILNAEEMSLAAIATKFKVTEAYVKQRRDEITQKNQDLQSASTSTRD